ncbi:DUF2891 domain-containing protein [Nonlabens marinus]|uniref:DUF2891 domain-containing protein n=1 Tax=Nonlabens marinus S1-08 TaxID=1454201 RepID=W8W0A2_9FLAO|nr:DUF2891 domain-containing protein [Nonlabens marinus]BAO55971.1 hypothetical protein NMS_1962 [Nonlabens marinus S1-08]
MKNYYIGITFLILSCNDATQQTVTDTTAALSTEITSIPTPQLTLEQANNLALLPLYCVDQEYPNKMGHVTASPKDQKRPTAQHPVFYGCFDWHSAVHGHWSAVTLLKQFPNLDKASELLGKLTSNITAANVAVEIEYLESDHNTTFERTYGWAWLLKLQQELDTWDTTYGRRMAADLKPLSDLIVERYIEYLPKLQYAIRVGEHSNTAFAMTLAWDYAVHKNEVALKSAIGAKAMEFYRNDEDCPISWEPSGYDFLSPCLEEVDIMRRVMPAEDFHMWLARFLPEMEQGILDIEIGKVSDRTDGKLVHIDGLNLSRAWVLYGLAAQYKRYEPLVEIADAHLSHTLPNLVADDYEGGHWLGSFAIYALQQAGDFEKNI